MEARPSDEASGDSIHQPEQAHLREETESDDSEIEATELRQLDDSDRAQRPSPSRVISLGKPQAHWYDPAKRLWRHHIRISVPHEDCRDHLANERTFLGYLRSSVALSMMGTMIAQLFRLQHREHPSKIYGYFVLSRPLSMIFQFAALIMILLGGIRFWRQQSAMAIGRVHAGGWEIIAVAVGSFSLLFGLFVIVVGVDIYKDVMNEP